MHEEMDKKLAKWYTHFGKNEFINFLEKNQVELENMKILNSKNNSITILFNSINDIDTLDEFYEFCNENIPSIEYQLVASLEEFVNPKEKYKEIPDSDFNADMDFNVKEMSEILKSIEELSDIVIDFKDVNTKEIETISRRTLDTNTMLNQVKKTKISIPNTKEDIENIKKDMIEVIKIAEDIKEKIETINVTNVPTIKKSREWFTSFVSKLKEESPVIISVLTLTVIILLVILVVM